MLTANDRIMVMDYPDIGEAEWTDAIPLGSFKALTVDELKQLRDVGVTTSLQFCMWQMMETEFGTVHWDILDRQVDRCREAGLKVVLMTPNNYPQVFPKEWYCWNVRGEVYSGRYSIKGWDCPSPWNMECRDYTLDFIDSVISRYRAPDFLAICCNARDGETVIPVGEPAIYDPEAVANHRMQFGCDPDVGTQQTVNWINDAIYESTMAQQELFATQGGELFCQLHRVHSHSPCEWGNAIDRIYGALRLNGIQFTFFPHGESTKNQVCMDAMRYNMPFWVGSEWPQGLNANTDELIRRNLRGFITAPIHPFTGHQQLDPWMVEAFKNAAQRLS